MALDCDNQRFFSTGAFQRRWPDANTTHPFHGAPGAIKQAETNCSRKTEYIISALQAEKTNNKWKKKRFRLHYIINVSMRACRR